MTNATRLIERDDALHELEGLLDHAASERGRVALVAGEAGIGKTSLMAALIARHPDCTVWQGACDALQAPHPLAPLYDIARAHRPAFAALLDDRELGRSALFQQIVRELESATRPVVFVVEDAHWADAATLDLLKFLGRRIRPLKCLLAVTYRDDEIDAFHPLRRLIGELPADATTRIDLQRLTPAGVEALARIAFRSADGLHGLTQGNPFFVTELLRHGSETVPHGVRDLVLSRYARLSPAARAIVQLASIVPTRTEAWLIERILAPTLEARDECLSSGLLVATQEAYGFRHELARAAVESALSIPTAQALHAKVLCVLETEAPGTSLARLVHHAVGASADDAVLRLAPAAARLAAERGAHKEAVAHLRLVIARAATLPDEQRAAYHENLSYECYLTERLTEAIEARESALALWRRMGDDRKAGATLRWLSRLVWYDGKTETARRYAGQAIAVLEPLPPDRELALAYSNRAQLHMLADEPSETEAWGLKALALATALGDREIESHALNNIGTARMVAGDPRGHDDLQRSLAIALADGYEEHAARAHTNFSSATVAAHQLALARVRLDEGIEYCELRDLDAWARYMRVQRAEVALALGDVAFAVAEAERVLAMPSAAQISRIGALAVCGRARARCGDRAADSALDEALTLARMTNEFQRTGPVAAARAEAAWLRGDVAAIAAEVWAVWDGKKASLSRSWTTSELAWWLHCAGALGAAPENCVEPYALQIAGRWREALRAWEEASCPLEAARALAEGDVDAQFEALDRFERLGASAYADRLRRHLQEAGVRGLPRGERVSTREHPFGLTRREAEVFELLVAGLRNQDIARRLHRSIRTIDHHVAAVLSKLGVGSRAEAIARAHAEGLVPNLGNGAGQSR